MADRWRDSSRTFSMFVYILALISLIMAKAALVMTLLRCKSRPEAYIYLETVFLLVRHRQRTH